MIIINNSLDVTNEEKLLIKNAFFCVLKALENGEIPKAKEEPNIGISLITTRQKIIKLADKLDFGWATVQEYVSDELAVEEADASNFLGGFTSIK